MLWKKETRESKNNSISEPLCTPGQELDFLAAIEAHVRWKVRLESYISGTCEEQLDANVICKDDQCLLGKWIYGVGGDRYGEMEKFQYIKEIHANFHRSAADVVRMVDSGDHKGAKNLLCHGDYSTYSHRIKSELARLSLELDYKK